MKRMNIGLVGSGPIAAAMAQAAHEVEGAKPYALYSRTYEKGRDFCNQMGIDFIYTDLEEMLNDENIDFIYLASPNSLHYHQAKEALLHGKNVIVEKPFSSNLKQAKELIDLAKKNDLWLFEAITIPHKKNYILLKEKIKELGKIKEVQCTYLQYSRKYEQLLEGQIPNTFNPKFSGGALMDLNIYNIHFLCGLFGKPEKTTYYCRKYDNGIDLGGTLAMEYEDFNAFALAAKDLNGDNRNLIAGENGYIIVHGGSNGPKPFTVCINGTEELFDVDDKSSWLFDELNDFYTVYDEDDRDKMDELLKQSEIAMSVIEEAKTSAAIVFDDDLL